MHTGLDVFQNIMVLRGQRILFKFQGGIHFFAFYFQVSGSNNFPPDRSFDLAKNVTFDLLKFDLIIIPLENNQIIFSSGHWKESVIIKQTSLQIIFI
jgi:hypothetical protein